MSWGVGMGKNIHELVAAWGVGMGENIHELQELSETVENLLWPTVAATVGNLLCPMRKMLRKLALLDHRRLRADRLPRLPQPPRLPQNRKNAPSLHSFLTKCRFSWPRLSRSAALTRTVGNLANFLAIPTCTKPNARRTLGFVHVGIANMYETETIASSSLECACAPPRDHWIDLAFFPKLNFVCVPTISEMRRCFMDWGRGCADMFSGVALLWSSHRIAGVLVLVSHR